MKLSEKLRSRTEFPPHQTTLQAVFTSRTKTTCLHGRPACRGRTQAGEEQEKGNTFSLICLQTTTKLIVPPASSARLGAPMHFFSAQPSRRNRRVATLHMCTPRWPLKKYSSTNNFSDEKKKQNHTQSRFRPTSTFRSAPRPSSPEASLSLLHLLGLGTSCAHNPFAEGDTKANDHVGSGLLSSQKRVPWFGP